jgi:hypothetical protein
MATFMTAHPIWTKWRRRARGSHRFTPARCGNPRNYFPDSKNGMPEKEITIAQLLQGIAAAGRILDHTACCAE